MSELVVLTGPSGAGKSSIAQGVRAYSPSMIKLVESHTTRLKRVSDLPREYRYLTAEQFSRNVERDVYLWQVEHAGVRYGTPRKAVDNALAKPNYVGIMIVVPSVLDTLIAHVADYKRRTRDYLARMRLWYVVPPEPDELVRRLRKRGDCDAHIQHRMEAERSWRQDVTSKYDMQEVSNHGSLGPAISQVVRRLNLHRPT